MRKTVLAVIGMGLGLAGGPLLAQNLQMSASPAASRAGLPGRGQTMVEVERAFGAPSQRLAAVGQPPISRWVYPGFVVYFEGSLVIHAVASSTAAPGG